MRGGVPTAFAMDTIGSLPDAERRSILFAQISDSHIGFSKGANPDVAATLQRAVDQLNALPVAPSLVLHTGDITQLSKAEEFDTAEQIIRGIRTDRVFYVSGEHDVLTDNGAEYRRRFHRSSSPGWYSFDHSGVHFVGLVNVLELKAGGLGALGAAQLEWLTRDLRPLPTSTPIVVFAHIPLWTVYPEWGWGTDDSAQALSRLKRFGSVTVLNGHIHQVMQKVEGHVQFHTAMSTAFPQPVPGTAPSPGPLTVESARLRSLLGTTTIRLVPGARALAIVDQTLDGTRVDDSVTAVPPAVATRTAPTQQLNRASQSPFTVRIDNFQFTPSAISVPAGTTVTWRNHDDVPHVIASSDGRFTSSRALDTEQEHSAVFKTRGTFRYFCSLHPKMTGMVVVA